MVQEDCIVLKQSPGSSLIKIVVILGPTGVGKTEAAVHLAKKFHGEIVNADSRQIYTELNIGVALPSSSFFEEISHHLFGVIPLNERWDVARFQTKADELIQKIHRRNHLPIIVGGSGLYIKSLLHGLFKGPSANPEIRERLQKRIESGKLEILYKELTEVDPEAVRTIHPNDTARILRALEVFEMTGKPISLHQKEHSFGSLNYRHLKIGLTVEREKLYQKINERVDKMIHSGLEEEVFGLFQRYGRHPLLQRAIGYKEWFAYFDGLIDRGSVVHAIKQNSRNFAKRQLTWFRKENDIIWHNPQEMEKIQNSIDCFLSES